MAKRFTATEKWTDPWFMSLSSVEKIAWCYLVDNCDGAGVIDLSRRLADFQIGQEVDWDGLIKASDGRIEYIERGKLWLTGFIQFQYGHLSEECRPHVPVFKLLDKHGLTERVFKGYSKGIHTLKEKDKEQDKETDKEKEGGSGGKPRKRFTPPVVSEVEAYCKERGNAVDAVQFVDFYAGKAWMIGKNKMADWKATVRTWERNGNDSRGSPATNDPRGNMAVLKEFLAKGGPDGKS